MIRPKSLQQRIVIFVLLPVALLLVVMGFAGFIYARKSMLAQWREAAILKLQRAAHQVDMRLIRTKDWIRFFTEASEGQDIPVLRFWAIEQLKQLESVDHVHLTSNDNQRINGDSSDERLGQLDQMAVGRHQERTSRRMMMRRFHSARTREITPPRYDDAVEHETVSLISDLNNETGQTVGQLEVVLDFDVLIKNIRESGWWQSNKAFLVSDNGNILAGTGSHQRRSLSESEDPLEVKTLQAMKSAPYGTVPGDGHPPKEVSGFYKLKEAPWTLVMIAPGKAILSPIVRFRSYYLAIGGGFILLIIFLIKFVTGRTVSSIKEVSQAAERIARGDFDKPLPVKSQDEVGELTRSFNTMMAQLEDRIRIKQALDVAMEVQQNLLPLETPQIRSLDIAARSIYCDETGGDFYDFIEVHRNAEDVLGIAVGDVSGHGISAALLMATIRAFIKSNVTLPTSIAESISRANRLMTQDMRDTGQFVTLFYTEISPSGKRLRWVRAGHDPAIFYDPNHDKFEDLRGEGIALGIDPDYKFHENTLEKLSAGNILVIATDGLWEAQNQKDEMFGKQRLKDLVRQHSESSSDAIIKAVIHSITKFQDSVRQEDDITLLVIKIIE
ncbi:MAG: SpoIIE family protein phosphatase [Desulfobacteraceae bacterium]|jgi:sigma-B regulation protein RsbU (phosphoserine phosphatase)|nr:SpoIIE family protein phosphatase [Desulfobacteraceae bacterium]